MAEVFEMPEFESVQEAGDETTEAHVELSEASISWGFKLKKKDEEELQ